MERKPFYAVNADYSNAVFGTLRVVGVIQSPTGFRYKLYCDPTLGGCGCQGQVVSLQTLGSTEVGTLRCANSGHGRIAENRSTDAHVEVRRKVEIVSSPRERAEAAARQAEIAELGGAQ